MDIRYSKKDEEFSPLILKNDQIDGLNTVTSPELLRNRCPDCSNLLFDEIVGVATVRKGYRPLVTPTIITSSVVVNTFRYVTNSTSVIYVNQLKNGEIWYLLEGVYTWLKLTTLSSDYLCSFAQMEGYLWIVNGIDIPIVWDGLSSTSFKLLNGAGVDYNGNAIANFTSLVPKFLLVRNNRLLLINLISDGSQILPSRYYDVNGNYSYATQSSSWVSGDALRINKDDGNEITSYGEYKGSLFISKDTNHYLVLGDYPNWSITKLPIVDRMRYPRTVVSDNNVLVGMKYDGIGIFDGSNFNDITRNEISSLFKNIPENNIRSFRKVVSERQNFESGTKSNIQSLFQDGHITVGQNEKHLYDDNLFSDSKLAKNITNPDSITLLQGNVNIKAQETLTVTHSYGVNQNEKIVELSTTDFGGEITNEDAKSKIWSTGAGYYIDNTLFTNYSFVVPFGSSVMVERYLAAYYIALDYSIRSDKPFRINTISFDFYGKQTSGIIRTYCSAVVSFYDGNERLLFDKIVTIGTNETFAFGNKVKIPTYFDSLSHINNVRIIRIRIVSQYWTLKNQKLGIGISNLVISYEDMEFANMTGRYISGLFDTNSNDSKRILAIFQNPVLPSGCGFNVYLRKSDVNTIVATFDDSFILLSKTQNETTYYIDETFSERFYQIGIVLTSDIGNITPIIPPFFLKYYLTGPSTWTNTYTIPVVSQFRTFRFSGAVNAGTITCDIMIKDSLNAIRFLQTGILSNQYVTINNTINDTITLQVTFNISKLDNNTQLWTHNENIVPYVDSFIYDYNVGSGDPTLYPSAVYHKGRYYLSIRSVDAATNDRMIVLQRNGVFSKFDNINMSCLTIMDGKIIGVGADNRMYILFEDDQYDDNGVSIVIKLRTLTHTLSIPLISALLRSMTFDCNRTSSFNVFVDIYVDEAYKLTRNYNVSNIGIKPYKLNFPAVYQGSRFFYEIGSRDKEFNFRSVSTELIPMRYSEGVKRE